MFHEKRKSYPGRKLVQGLQVGLAIAVGLFGLAALDHAYRQQQPAEAEIVFVEPSYNTTYTYEQQPEIAYSALDYFHFALSAQEGGDYSTAIEYYTHAIELEPSEPAFWLNRGVAYEQMLNGSCAGKSDFWQYLQRNTVETYSMEVALNQTTTLDMAEGRMYILTFAAQAGDVLNVSATSVVAGEAGEQPGVADPLLMLMDAGQQPLLANDDTLRSDGSLITADASLNNYMIMRDGTYSILLSHAGARFEHRIEGMVDVMVSLR